MTIFFLLILCDNAKYKLLLDYYVEKKNFHLQDINKFLSN